MFLLQIIKKNKLNYNNNLVQIIKVKQYIKNLNESIILLKQVKKKNRIKILRFLLAKNDKILTINQSLIKYVVKISLSKTNTLIHVTDIKGNLKFFQTAGYINLTGKQKAKQPLALIKLLKVLIMQAKFLTNQVIALHFKNITKSYKLFIIFMLEKRFIIRFIKDYNLQPYNGCRPKKIRRKKKGKKLMFKH